MKLCVESSSIVPSTELSSQYLEVVTIIVTFFSSCVSC